MVKNKIQKNSNTECKKDYEPCINYEKCNGNWFKYKAKEDNGFCKACVKKDKEKIKGIKIDDNRNYTYNCKTNGCEKGLIL